MRVRGSDEEGGEQLNAGELQKIIERYDGMTRVVRVGKGTG